MEEHTLYCPPIVAKVRAHPATLLAPLSMNNDRTDGSGTLDDISAKSESIAHGPGSVTVEIGTDPKHRRRHVGNSKKKRPQIDVTWEDVSLIVTLADKGCCSTTPDDGPKTKDILKGLSGAVHPGQLLALMGPSGAGKTSLLNCLSGGSTAYTGTILLNGRPWNNTLKRCTAYVQQDDLFLPQLTVHEHLSCVAVLRMDHGLSEQEREAAVEDAIDMLGLEKCRDTLIGDPAITRGISGGERKRLSIAGEIVNDPSLIFLDEPTSGLDSFMAESVITQLRELASNPVRPRTVIATIHQPSSQAYKLFDQLNLIADGRNAYLGSASGVIPYFEAFGPLFACPERMNPSDYFLSLLSPQAGNASHPLQCDSECHAVFALCSKPLIFFLVSQVNAEHVRLVCDRFQINVGAQSGTTPEAIKARESSGRFCAAGMEPATMVVDGVDSQKAAGAAAVAEGEGGDDVVFKSRFAARWYTQISALLGRYMLIKSRNPREVQVSHKLRNRNSLTP